MTKVKADNLWILRLSAFTFFISITYIDYMPKEKC